VPVLSAQRLLRIGGTLAAGTLSESYSTPNCPSRKKEKAHAEKKDIRELN